MKEITYYRILLYILPLALIALMLTASSCNDIPPTVIDTSEKWQKADSMIKVVSFNCPVTIPDGKIFLLCKTEQDIINHYSKYHLDTNNVKECMLNSPLLKDYPFSSNWYHFAAINTQNGSPVTYASFINYQDSTVEIRMYGNIITNITGVTMKYFCYQIPKKYWNFKINMVDSISYTTKTF